MSLATRCSSCGTVFRVVQDQLKVSEGWVRCGRCEEVFNALEGLFDLDREAPPPWQPDAEAPLAEPVEDWGPTGGKAPAGSVPLPDYPYAQAAGLDRASLLDSPGVDGLDEADDDAASKGDFADARFNSALFDADDDRPNSVPADTVADTVANTQAQADSELAAAEPPPAAAPLFVRQADRDARWRHPLVRATMVAAAVVLTATLTAQWGVHFRDSIAAQWPASRPVLEALCGLADCHIDAPRRLDSLAVDSSGLSRIESLGAYRFSMVLRNRGATEVLLPAVELALTDAQGQLIARKVVTMAELGATQASLAAGSELALQTALSAGERRIAGYQIEIFYP